MAERDGALRIAPGSHFGGRTRRQWRVDFGAEMDLESGDRIIKVNGRVVRDYLDFRFQTAGETDLVLKVRKKRGEDGEVEPSVLKVRLRAVV